MKRFVRLLSTLLIVLLAYATVGEGACAAESLPAGAMTLVSAPDHGTQTQFPDEDGGCVHGCAHGHHHLDTAPMAGMKSASPEPSSELTFETTSLLPLHRPGSLERPPRI